MAPVHNKISGGPVNLWEQLQFWTLFTMVFSWFLLAAVAKWVTMQRGNSSESCWQEAKRSAYSTIPYAFMRI